MSALVLFLSFEIEIGDGPGPELDNRLFSKPSTLILFLLVTVLKTVYIHITRDCLRSTI